MELYSELNYNDRQYVNEYLINNKKDETLKHFTEMLKKYKEKINKASYQVGTQLSPFHAAMDSLIRFHPAKLSDMHGDSPTNPNPNPQSESVAVGGKSRRRRSRRFSIKYKSGKKHCKKSRKVRNSRSRRRR